MSALLTIFNIGAEDDVCRSFLPWWEKSGCSLLFSSPYDARSQLDGVLHFYAGRALTDRHVDRWFLQARVLATMKFVLTLPFETYHFTQYDSVCLAPLPSLASHQILASDVCGPVPGQFKATRGLHPPWSFGRSALSRFIEASAVLNIRTAEHGIMDRWLPLVLETAGIAYHNFPRTFSRNSFDTPEIVSAARAAVADGAIFLHGCKNQEQLRAVIGDRTP